MSRGLAQGAITILFAKDIDLIRKVALYQYYIVTVTLHNSTGHLQYSYSEYGARNLFYFIIE